MTDHLDRTRAAYDTVADDYQRLVPELFDQDLLGRGMLSSFAEHIGTEGAPVLDVGCGTGVVTSFLAQAGLKVSGIDLSPGMIEVARREHPELSFEVGTMTALSQPDGELAGVVAWWSIIHTPPAELPAAFAEFARVLAPGGRLLVGFHVGDGIHHLASAYGHDTDYDVHLLRPENVAALMVRSGFQISATLAMTGRNRPQACLLAEKSSAGGVPANRTVLPAGVHHLELWVPDYPAARTRWGWLLGELGWTDYQDWPSGHSWRAPDGSYLVVEQSSALTGTVHDRTAPGLNHLALNSDRSRIDRICSSAAEQGWTLLFPDRHPHAGGPEHFAAYLADEAGYEVELVAVD